jgi:serine/threonine-protein kinase
VEGDNLGQVLKRLTNQGITPLSRVAPDVPADLADLVDQMLVTERDERLVDLSRVRNVLGRYARGGRDAFVGPVTPKRARRGALAAAGVFLSATVAIGAAWALHGPHRRGVAEVAPVPTPHPITTTQVATDSRSGPEAAPALAEGRAAAIDPSRAPPAQRPAPSGTAPHRLHGRTAPSAAPSSVSPAPTASTILGGLVARPPF